jgi:stage II sporulation protein D
VPDGQTLRGALREGRVTVTLPDGIAYADAAEIWLEPDNERSLLVVGTIPYRGRFTLRSSGTGVTLVETLDIEEYLRGVVGWEIGWLKPELHAAMEAQAIAARTYTCARLGQYQEQGFDLYADVRDQVYKGALRQDPVVDRAIAATRGQVLRYDGVLIQAYYSSTCGGFTSWVENVWPKPAAPYLRGRRDASGDGASFCAASPHFRWIETWTADELQNTLKRTLPSVLQLPANTAIGTLRDLRVTTRDESARALDLEIETSTGTFRVHGDSIRWALQPAGRAILRSLMFELDLDRRDGRIVRISARGGGNGHGVGMCQTGAQSMARQGFEHEAILAHYYPGARLARGY